MLTKTMSTRRGTLVALLLLGTVCCSTQVGLANAPSINRKSPSAAGRHDAIANGHESCEAASEQRPDPLPNRLPPCAEDDPKNPPIKTDPPSTK